MYIIVHSLPAPLGAINGRLPDCPLVHALHPLKDVNMPSDNHLTGALHSGHVYRLPPAPARCHAWILATLPITDIHRFNSLPSLYRSSSVLATCYVHFPMEGLLAIEVLAIWLRKTLLCCIDKKSPPAENVEVHLIGCLITFSFVRGLAKHLCRLPRLFIFQFNLIQWSYIYATAAIMRQASAHLRQASAQAWQ